MNNLFLNVQILPILHFVLKTYLNFKLYENTLIYLMFYFIIL
jgi:hypothetical protein